MEEERKYNERVKIICIVVITVLITFCATVIFYNQYLSSKGALTNSYDSSEEIEEQLNTLRTLLEKYYKGDIDDDSLIVAALQGYVSGLGDAYTEYLTADEWDELNSELTDYVGIGVYLSELKDTGETVVIGVIGDDSPAAEAGIQAGDIIKEVNLEDVSTQGVEYVSTKVKGEEGTTVKIKVLRGDEELTFDIERRSVKVYEVKYEMLDNNIGYIDFYSFTDTCDDEFKAAYESLVEQGATSLIVDLRNNGGGYVDSALNIADLFVDKGETLLITEDKDGNRTTDVAQTEKTINMPVVLLVNEYSASASEILTGILKDYNIATVVGTITYGKGVIQTVLTDVLEGALKVTTAEYFTPTGNKINEIGIEPDVEVEIEENDDENSTQDTDTQLQKAIELLKN